jgi:hypothetical protein
VSHLVAHLVEIGFLMLFLVAPLLLGYATGSYWAALIPALSLVLAAHAVVASADSPYRDEVDVLPWLWLILSATAVALCVAGVAVKRWTGRKRRSSKRESRPPYASG